MGVSHTTISRRVDHLEGDLGARLFDRDVGGYRLTGAGETMMRSAVRAEEALLTAQRQLQGRDAQLSGEIMLTTSDLMVNSLLMLDLVRFTKAYPSIDLSLLVSSDLFDLGRREADVAVRMMRLGRPPPEDLVGRKLITAMSCYYACDAYLEEHDPWQASSGARWIGWDDEERFPQWVKSSPFPRIPVYNKLNNVSMQIEAARHGMGLAVLPCFVGDISDGLVRVPHCEPYHNYDVWLLSHPDLRETARIRTFRNFIIEVFAEKHDVLTGKKSDKGTARALPEQQAKM